jgi:hypothetical protein
MESQTYDLEYVVNVAKAVFDRQTGEELAQLKTHFGEAYQEAKIVALIAVRMVARIAGLQEEPADTRHVSPVDTLVKRALLTM